MSDAPVSGHCDERFSSVREAFEKTFGQGEVGASVALTIDGESVIDLWGGHADAARTQPWERDTIANVYSTTKGVTAVCAHRLVEEGRLDLDAPVARYWPEFAQEGKGEIPVHMLLSHRAGLPATTERVPHELRYDWDAITGALAASRPWWTPGEKHGYHALTFGHLVGEVVRRVDGRSLGNYWREEFAEPLGLDFHIGVGPELDARCAEMIPTPPPAAGAPDFFGEMRKNPDSLPARVFGATGALDRDVNTRAWREAEIPAGNGHGTALSLARLYGALATDGTLDGRRVLAEESVARANTEQALGEDEVLRPLQTRFGLGFMMTGPMIPFGPNPRAFGHPGAGGSIAFADPDARLGFGYVMNQMQMGLAGGMFGFALIGAIYAALGESGS